MKANLGLLSLACAATFLGSSTLIAGGALADPSCCWVHVWEDENYHDDNDKISCDGSSCDYPNMRNLPGANKDDWGDEIDSLKVGSCATVTVWEDEEYDDNSDTYGPGTEKTNLRGEPDLGDTIDSMKMSCS